MLFSMFNFMGKWIWKINILPRIQVFVWMYLHDSIDLKDCFLMARGIVNDTISALCRRELEMIIHALRACDVVKTNWNQLEINHFDSDFFSCNLQDWLGKNSKLEYSKVPNHPSWKITFLFAIWIISQPGCFQKLCS